MQVVIKSWESDMKEIVVISDCQDPVHVVIMEDRTEIQPPCVCGALSRIEPLNLAVSYACMLVRYIDSAREVGLRDDLIREYVERSEPGGDIKWQNLSLRSAEELQDGNES